MKVLFDHQVFIQRYGGASKYYVEMFQRLPPDSYMLSLLFSDNQYLKEMGLKYPRIGIPRIMSYCNGINTAFHLKCQNYTIYHPTEYNMNFCQFMNRKAKSVITFHDSTIAKFPEFFGSWKTSYIKSQRKAIATANHIITVSEHSKRDLIEFWKADESKITTIYHGVNHAVFPKETSSLHPRPYLLYVGTRELYKNFSKSLEAFRAVSQKYPELDLICTGKQFTATERDEIARKNLSQRIRVIQASESQMAQLYQHAVMFIYPSLYEGFGMPILEAMKYHCPVALSNASCFPEIAQDAGAYFDPRDTESIIHTLEHLLTDSAYRAQLIKRGDERAALFSWEKCAQEHLKIYKFLSEN